VHAETEPDVGRHRRTGDGEPLVLMDEVSRSFPNPTSLAPALAVARLPIGVASAEA